MTLSTDLAAAQPSRLAPSATAIEQQRSAPVLIWAGLGAAFLLAQIYVVSTWLLDGAESVPAGPSPIPDHMRIGLGILTASGFVLFPGLLYLLLIRPWRRNGRISHDGLFCLVFMLIWWLDPMVNMTGPYLTYNSSLLNRGSWLGAIPGWPLANAEQIAEPLLLSVPMYLYGVLPAILLGNFVMRRAQRRWPGISKLGLIGICFGFFIVYDLFFELTVLRLGFWSFFSTVDSLTLFSDRYYRFPVYEVFFGAGIWTAWSCLRFFKDDKGHTLAERGAERLKLRPSRVTAVRFLALSGMCSVFYFAIFLIPMQYFIINSDPPPADVLKRSYFLNGQCGEGLPRSCPGPAVPTAKPNSAYLSPEGKLVVPSGVHLPDPVEPETGSR